MFYHIFQTPRPEHLKKHNRPYKCTAAQCDKAFQLQTGLDRHINEKHNDSAPRYFCPWRDAGCASKVARHGTTRKDNLNRHIKGAHKGQQP
ncbi:hypothetical protein B0I37DRAFT_449386 [Chaetomium sp. MPI-CAGE-AT-0009]|nr:hypothetical protein B0I37DRAFT_449386 [Chaetomium sp. MPI-CAGE-AT-0009]